MSEISPNVVLQPHLGRMKENYKPQENIGGYLALGKITTVHHKSGTVDIELVRTGDTIISSGVNEGRFGARMTTSSAHFNSKTMTSSGTVHPVQEGQLVILAFLDGLKHEPVILGTLHNTWEEMNNVLTSVYPLMPEKDRDDYRNALKYLSVHPSQFYTKIDGDANVEVSHPSGTFMVMGGDSTVNDDTFTHEDLTENDPIRGTTRKGVNDATIRPVRTLYCHQSYKGNYGDPLAFTKMFVDSLGTFRLTRDYSDGKLSYLELDMYGKFLFRRQNDSQKRSQGQNYTELEVGIDGSYKVSQQKVSDGQSSRVDILIGADSSLKLSRSKGSDITSITVDVDNNMILSHQSGSYIKFDTNGDIIIKSTGKIRMNQG